MAARWHAFLRAIALTGVLAEIATVQGYGSHLVAVPSQQEALRLLAAGRHDCALVAKFPHRFSVGYDVVPRWGTAKTVRLTQDVVSR